MSYREERLYYACMNFCESFFHLLCEKEKIRNEWHPNDSREAILRFEGERLDNAYERLFKAVEDWENENKGVIGQNKYYLELRRIDE